MQMNERARVRVETPGVLRAFLFDPLKTPKKLAIERRIVEHGKDPRRDDQKPPSATQIASCVRLQPTIRRRAVRSADRCHLGHGQRLAHSAPLRPTLRAMRYALHASTMSAWASRLASASHALSLVRMRRAWAGLA